VVELVSAIAIVVPVSAVDPSRLVLSEAPSVVPVVPSVVPLSVFEPLAVDDPLADEDVDVDIDPPVVPSVALVVSSPTTSPEGHAVNPTAHKPTNQRRMSGRVAPARACDHAHASLRAMSRLVLVLVIVAIELLACAPKSTVAPPPDATAAEPTPDDAPPVDEAEEGEEPSPAGEDSTCTKEECGPAPGMPNHKCPDGKTIAGPACGRDAEGKCGWQVVECPE
jgi:hypothetical protein